MERFTNHRYFASPWVRTTPLKGFEEDGSTEKVLREEGAKEYSRIRKNGFAYVESHGLGISSGGITEATTEDQTKSLAYELGTLLVEDASAKLGNWFAADFEKVKPPHQSEVHPPNSDSSPV